MALAKLAYLMLSRAQPVDPLVDLCGHRQAGVSAMNIIQSVYNIEIVRFHWLSR
jgi:hypothetical protein